ncbi:MAG TPA: GldG family protein [Verrucomicrobiae bacterium]|nr:GldG family protein [Verrucomicrobiae bacterium]
MASSSSSPSFSPGRKWAIVFNVLLASAAVFLILIGVNYLSSRYFFKRFYVSADSHVQLSPRTISLLKSLTNTVDVTIYYDKNAPFYSDIAGLLREYEAHTRKLTVRTVDYYNDPGAAQDLKVKYSQLSSVTNRDFIIFDCDGRQKFVDGNSLSDYKATLVRSKDPSDPRLGVNKKRVHFTGEQNFSAALFAVTQPKPLKAYFLLGHGERSPEDTSDTDGYSKLADLFRRNYVQVSTLKGLLGTNPVPTDCNLLVIAGPRAEFETNELNKISQYLDQGGRLFALFDIFSTNRDTGLENILTKWNVQVSHSVVVDPDNFKNGDYRVLGLTVESSHDAIKSISGKMVEIIMPRPIERIKAPSPSALDELRVSELLSTGTNSFLSDNPSGGRRPYPVIAAVERNAAKGVATERGTTRMIIAGDSFFLANQVMAFSVNQDFADSALNWLLERTELLTGVGPTPVTEYRLMLLDKQVTALKGILLGGIPGGILLLGGVVWLRRRK